MTAKILYADSEHSADQYYATGIFIPDPFLCLITEDGQRHLLLSVLEVDRARRTAKVDQVHNWEEWRTRLVRETGEPAPKSGQVIAFFLKTIGVTTVDAPGDFPLALADALREQGLTITAQSEAFWPERAIKRQSEVIALEEAQRITGLGMAAGIERIRAATIEPSGELWLNDAPLTSERVRQAMHVALVKAGAMPSHTIVSGGLQGADPHEVGSGPLYAHQPIIMDCFPRISATGYWGDMTRTVCRGEPPPRLQAMWEAVRQAQARAMAQIRDQANGLTIHNDLLDFFSAQGYPTGQTEAGRQCGFFHGTGHGLGLEIHEAPRIGKADHPLLAGHVVTVEPGLYYPDFGGVRLEDVVLVTAEGCRNLTDFPKYLEV